ncbi:MAG TPA: SpoIIE family protein phosphatase [Anaeromyxobacter sp.]|nr:SpoIIE family protein phosphatase [Anaeromyxobacter sp.]
MTVLQRIRSSLRLRILLTTLGLLALALGVAVVAFERVAASVVRDAVHSHLSARAREVQDSVGRFQRERMLTVRNWAEAEAMQLTLDSGDPKFAEDHFRKTIQDQGGAVETVALLNLEQKVVALVRHAHGDVVRGEVLAALRGARIDVPAFRAGAGEDDVSVALAPLTAVLKEGESGDTIVFTAPVRDFAWDLTGWIVAALAADAVPLLLEEVNGKGGLYVPVVADRDRRLVLTLPRMDAAAVRPVIASAPQGPLGALERIEREGIGAALAVRTAAAPAAPGWSTLMLVDEGQAEGRVTQLRIGLLVLFAAVLAGAAGAAVLSLREASRPLGDVAASMDRVAEGDLSTRVRAEYSGELGRLVTTFNTMVEEVSRARDELQRTEALRREVEIAHQIQTAILPVSPAVPGFEVAARMKPADDVGGDLYDILAFGDTFWVLVGDVSGHGINSGLVMMMAQAAAYAAIADDPHCTPAAVIAAVNRVVHENVRRRMRRDDYLTLMAARHMGDGRFVAAGAHQPVFIARGGGKVDVIEPAGPWVGLSPSVEPPPVPEYEFRLGKGDLVFFLTDGLLEAKDGGTDLFGEDRVRDLLARGEVPSASQALTDVFSAVERFSHEQADDMTGVVLRRKNEQP